MAKRRIDKDILESINRYLEKLSKYYRIDAVYLFGSYANGTPREDSDIDLAIVSRDVTDRLEDMGRMLGYTWKCDTRIEPHPYNTNDFSPNEYMLVGEILRTGIKVA